MNSYTIRSKNNLIKSGEIYLNCDCEESVLICIAQLCKNMGIPIQYIIGDSLNIYNDNEKYILSKHIQKKSKDVTDIIHKKPSRNLLVNEIKEQIFNLVIGE